MTEAEKSQGARSESTGEAEATRTVREERSETGPAPDTIAALATPPGVGALAVVRISGPEAFRILERLCRPSAPSEESPTSFREGPTSREESTDLAEPRRATLMGIRDPDSGELLDRALVTLFPGPRSYTCPLYP
ncbi:MAG: hypothetical protein ACOC8K_09755, partial [Gemmatimonadota bacterium]